MRSLGLTAIFRYACFLALVQTTFAATTYSGDSTGSPIYPDDSTGSPVAVAAPVAAPVASPVAVSAPVAAPVASPVAVSAPVAAPVASPVAAASEIQCLEPGSILVDIETNNGNKYTFNGTNYNSAKKIGLKQGVYTFINISKKHPLRFRKSINATDDEIKILPKNLPSSIQLVNCTTTVDDKFGGYCVGNLTIEVTGTVDGESFNCKEHGWMGGERQLVNCGEAISSCGSGSGICFPPPPPPSPLYPSCRSGGGICFVPPPPPQPPPPPCGICYPSPPPPPPHVCAGGGGICYGNRTRTTAPTNPTNTPTPYPTKKPTNPTIPPTSHPTGAPIAGPYALTQYTIDMVDKDNVYFRYDKDNVYFRYNTDANDQVNQVANATKKILNATTERGKFLHPNNTEYHNVTAVITVVTELIQTSISDVELDTEFLRMDNFTVTVQTDTTQRLKSKQRRLDHNLLVLIKGSTNDPDTAKEFIKGAARVGNVQYVFVELVSKLPTSDVQDAVESVDAAGELSLVPVRPWLLYDASNSTNNHQCTSFDGKRGSITPVGASYNDEVGVLTEFLLPICRWYPNYNRLSYNSVSYNMYVVSWMTICDIVVEVNPKYSERLLDDPYETNLKGNERLVAGPITKTRLQECATLNGLDEIRTKLYRCAKLYSEDTVNDDATTVNVMQEIDLSGGSNSVVTRLDVDGWTCKEQTFLWDADPTILPSLDLHKIHLGEKFQTDFDVIDDRNINYDVALEAKDIKSTVCSYLVPEIEVTHESGSCRRFPEVGFLLGWGFKVSLQIDNEDLLAAMNATGSTYELRIDSADVLSINGDPRRYKHISDANTFDGKVHPVDAKELKFAITGNFEEFDVVDSNVGVFETATVAINVNITAVSPTGVRRRLRAVRAPLEYGSAPVKATVIYIEAPNFVQASAVVNMTTLIESDSDKKFDEENWLRWSKDIFLPILESTNLSPEFSKLVSHDDNVSIAHTIDFMDAYRVGEGSENVRVDFRIRLQDKHVEEVRANFANAAYPLQLDPSHPAHHYVKLDNQTQSQDSLTLHFPDTSKQEEQDTKNMSVIIGSVLGGVLGIFVLMGTISLVVRKAYVGAGHQYGPVPVLGPETLHF